MPRVKLSHEVRCECRRLSEQARCAAKPTCKTEDQLLTITYIKRGISINVSDARTFHALNTITWEFTIRIFIRNKAENDFFSHYRVFAMGKQLRHNQYESLNLLNH